MHPDLSNFRRLPLLLLLLFPLACSQIARHQDTARPCIECHAEDLRHAGGLNHQQEGFPTDCEQCHPSKDHWTPVSFDHQAFRLDGKHAEISCDSCHDKQPVPTTCVGCHEQDRSRPTYPDHSAPGFSTDCSSCHTTAAWKPTTFTHDAFPLDGKHATLSCSSCHDKQPVPTTCVGCHEADRSRPTAPDHRAAGFNTDCSACHTTTGWTIATMACKACHGSAVNDAPPLSVGGSTVTTDRGVGAHQAHLTSSTWHAVVSCDACHLVPQLVTDSGHNDTALPAETTFSGLAGNDGASPTWNGSTCTGTYCHGATLSGGAQTAPVWTQVDGSQSTCQSCHGMPPGNGHTSSTACSDCHGDVVNSSNIIIAPQLHIDGKVDVTGSMAHPAGWSAAAVHGPAFITGSNGCKSCHGNTLMGGSAGSCDSCHSGWQTNCTFCHGGQNNNTGAPPTGVDGETNTSQAPVGRHTSHLTDGATHLAYSCSTCHTIPANALSTGHIDSAPAELAFAGLAAGTTYNPGTAQCQNNYCHGNGRAGSTGQASWTGSLSGGCSACHDDESDGGNMTLSGRHRLHVVNEGYGCNTCHGCEVSAQKVITDKSKHVNGTRDVCLSLWNAGNRTCSSGTCHGSENW